MDDLVSEFITETSESLAVLDQQLVTLEKNPGDEAILGSIFRIVHTIKGTCGFLGLPKLEAVAHASENVLGRIRDKTLEVSPEAISLILESLDNIKAKVEHLAAQGTEAQGDDAGLIARLNAFAEAGNADTVLPAVPAAAQVLPVPAQISEPVAAASPPPSPLPTPTGGVDPEPQREAASTAQSIRVNLDVLEQLMQMVGELVLTRNQLLQIARGRQDNHFMSPLQQLSQITTELQEGIMKTRMQPIGNAWAKFPRIVRDLSHELGKKIELKMVGADTELDRQMLEMIKDPLTHMVRNSCDHGLEDLEGRHKAGKPETGVITLSAYHEGGHILIEISDDGRGINVDKVSEKILRNGLATEAELARMTDQQIIQYIFRAGFSTAEKITSVSGRGVGMDVVKTNIEKIGGTIELQSKLGEGSKFTIRIPLTLAIASVLIVEADGQRYAIPQVNVRELVKAGPQREYRVELLNRNPVLRLRDKLLPLTTLSEVLQLPHAKPLDEGDEAYVVVLRVGGFFLGLVVDRIHDTEEIVVKPVSSLLEHIRVFAGNTILGDGSVIMILDPNGLAATVGEEGAHTELQEDLSSEPVERSMGFVLFSAGDSTPKAVPLELVSRLEEIDASRLEYSGGIPVVQYRGELMRMVTLDDSYSLPKEGICEVIVFVYDNRITGLVVESIIDIVEAPLQLKLASDHPGLLGSNIINGRTTDIIDVGHFIGEAAENIAAVREAAKEKKTGTHELLLVEDSPFFRNLTVPFLASFGFHVTAAEDAEQALYLLRHHKYDVIVSDIEMPGMNGFEFTEICRMQHKLKVPIIAFTSTVNHDLLEKGKGAGFDAFILKTDREGIIRAIFNHLDPGREVA